MKKVCLLLAAIMIILCLSFQTQVFADTIVLNENFDDGKCDIKNAKTNAVSDNIIDADAGDEAYGKVFKTLASSNLAWYMDLGQTFTAEDNNVVKISMDIKAPMTANKNVMFYFADSSNVSTRAYDVYSSSYRKKAFYFRKNGNMGVNKDTASGGSWYTSTTDSVKAYTAGKWYHIDIVVDLYKQMATYYLDKELWATSSFGASGTFESFDMIGVYTESANQTGYWYIDNLTVTDQTVEVDESILFEADFEDVSSGAEAGLTFAYGAAQSAVVDAEDTFYGKVLQFAATETVTSRFKVPVNAFNPANKSVSMSFDLYAEEADKVYCMIYLYDSKGKDYKILCRNSNQAAGKMGYFKFLNIGAPWKPVGTVSKGAGTWVHVDGIFEFRDNQTIIKWYFDGVKAGTTYSYGLKDISYIRFNVNKTETADVTKVYAIDNILMRQYENNSFNTKHTLSGSGAETTLEITPKSNLAKDFSVQNCNFEIVNSQTGAAATVAAKEYKDGKLVLTLSGLEYSQPYTVTSSDFCDIYGQKMEGFEFFSNPQYDEKNAVVPQIKAVWFYDYDGNRLTANQVTTEVNKMEILFNTRIKASTITGISLGDLTLTGEYSSKNNSYTATWGGYLEPNTSYPLSVTGIVDVNGKAMADYLKNITTGDGTVNVKSIELLNSAGETATATDIVEGAVLTAKLNVLNTTGEAVNGVLAYGIYKDSYMTDNDFTHHYLEAGGITEVDMEIPYSDATSKLKIFMWDELSKLNAYYSGFDFQE